MSTSYGFSLKGPGDESSMKYETAFDSEDDRGNPCNKCVEVASCGPIKCYSCESRNDCIFCCTLIMMLVALFMGVIGPLAINALIDDTVNSQVVIDSPSAPSYDIWVTNAEGEGTKTKVTFDVYFFHTTNPQAILTGSKPVVVEVGPYAYDEYFKKFDIEWTDDGDTVTYNIYKYFIFNKDRTGPGLSEQDNITIPYAAALGFQWTIGNIPIPDAANAFLEAAMEQFVFNAYINLVNQITDVEQQIKRNPDYSVRQKKLAVAALDRVIDNIGVTTDELIAFMKSSNPIDLFFKMMLGRTPSGISPFWTTNPSLAYFGWLNDPLLKQIQGIINIVVNSTTNVTYIPWTSAVPGSLPNYTSIEDTRRRRQRDTYKTGKKDTRRVGEFVSYQQMTSTWACADPAASQDPNAYVEGEEFPACELFDPSWNDETTHSKGYNRPFATPRANKVQGYNGEMFGRPVTTDFLQLYSGDVYRSSYFHHVSDNDDLYGLKLKRYMVQPKDLLNCSSNPVNCEYYNFAPSGMGNITSAVNAPAWISNPHFYGADPLLIQSIGGMNPNPDIHRTYVDIEPQTGQIGRGFKTVQVNWEMKSYYMASVSYDVVTQTEQYCRDIQVALNILNRTNNDTNTTVPTIECDLTVAIQTLTSLATPADWNYNKKNDTLYFPAYYCREANQLSEADANDLQAQLFDTEDMVADLQRWCFNIAGGLAILLAVMILVRRNSDRERKYKYQTPDKANASLNNTLAPLLHEPNGTAFT